MKNEGIYPQFLKDQKQDLPLAQELIGKLINPSDNQDTLKGHIAQFISDTPSSPDDNILLLYKLILDAFPSYLSDEQKNTVNEALTASYMTSSALVTYLYFAEHFEQGVFNFFNHPQFSDMMETRILPQPLPDNPLLQFLLYREVQRIVKDYQEKQKDGNNTIEIIFQEENGGSFGILMRKERKEHKVGSPT